MTDDQGVILSNLSPSVPQKRVALVLVMFLLVAYFFIAGPLSTIRPLYIEAFLPIYATAMFMSDLITAVLLFAQFSILRSHALLAAASGYCFTALITVPWILTFPEVFAPNGLLGASVESASWLYLIWHAAFPMFVVAYAVLKGRDFIQAPREIAILLSTAAVVAAVFAASLLVTLGHELLPRIVLDAINFSPLWWYAAGFSALMSLLAAALLWMRLQSVLDLWLSVVMCSFAIEVILIPYRYSVGWYCGKICGLLAGNIVLFVLLYETVTLYARLLHVVRARRREREARLMTGDTIAAAISHEVNQPLAAARNNVTAALNFLDRTPPDLVEVREALACAVKDNDRASTVVRGIRALMQKAPTRADSVDLNEAVREVLELTQGEVLKHRVSVQTQLADGLPLIQGDRVQLQQVVLNLILNAVQAMGAVADRTRKVLITTSQTEPNAVCLGVRDTGPGLSAETLSRLFEPFYTTKPDGMGMGLSICRSIIEAHGGRLWATRCEPRGALFQFTIPAD